MQAALGELQYLHLLSGADWPAGLTKFRTPDTTVRAFYAQKKDWKAYLQKPSCACRHQTLSDPLRHCQKEKGLGVHIKLIPSRFDCVMKTAHPSLRAQMNCNRPNTTLKIDDQTVNLPPMFMYPFVCQAGHLPRTPLIEK